MAASFARRLLELGPKPDVAQQVSTEDNIIHMQVLLSISFSNNLFFFF